MSEQYPLDHATRNSNGTEAKLNFIEWRLSVHTKQKQSKLPVLEFYLAVAMVCLFWGTLDLYQSACYLLLITNKRTSDSSGIAKNVMDCV